MSRSFEATPAQAAELLAHALNMFRDTLRQAEIRAATFFRDHPGAVVSVGDDDVLPLRDRIHVLEHKLARMLDDKPS